MGGRGAEFRPAFMVHLHDYRKGFLMGPHCALESGTLARGAAALLLASAGLAFPFVAAADAALARPAGGARITLVVPSLATRSAASVPDEAGAEAVARALTADPSLDGASITV